MVKSPLLNRDRETGHVATIPNVKVIVIVSAGRSGSTLLDMLLGSVEGFFSGGELRYLWERGVIAERRCGCGRRVAECEVWSKALSAPALTRLDPAEVVSWQHVLARVRHTRQLLDAAHDTRRDPRLQQLIDAMGGLYKELGRVTACRVIIDSSKRPSDAALSALLPGVDTYVVHLVRDPRAVAYSWRRRKEDFDHELRPEMERRGVVRSAIDWLWLNAVASGIPRHAPGVRFLDVRYEDVIAHPTTALARILEFVGEGDATPRVHDDIAQLAPNHTLSGNPGRFSTGDVRLRVDEEWRDAMRPISWLIVTALTARRAPSVRVPARRRRAVESTPLTSLDMREFATGEPTVDIVSEIRIDCPIQLVSTYVSDPLNMPLWRQNVWAVERLSPTALAEGSRIGLKTRTSRRKSSIVYEVTEFVPETRLVMRTVLGPRPLETTYIWKDTPSGATHLTLRNRSKPTGLARRALPVVTAAARRANRNDLERLKDLLEYA